MTTASLRSGACPGCGGRDVYTSRGKPSVGERSHLSMFPSTKLWLDTYVCLACGHFEEVLPEDELKKHAAEIRALWSKV